jgi:hypothetical protein
MRQLAQEHLPLSLSVFLQDLTLVPLGYILAYQYTSRWKNFFIGSVIASGAWAFIMKPVFSFFDILRLYNWNYLYSFILLVLIGNFARFAFLLVLKVEQGYSVPRSITLEMKSVVQPAMKPLDEEDRQDKE